LTRAFDWLSESCEGRIQNQESRGQNPEVRGQRSEIRGVQYPTANTQCPMIKWEEKNRAFPPGKTPKGLRLPARGWPEERGAYPGKSRRSEEP
jgi:hypothetical protein